LLRMRTGWRLSWTNWSSGGCLRCKEGRDGNSCAQGNSLHSAAALWVLALLFGCLGVCTICTWEGCLPRSVDGLSWCQSCAAVQKSTCICVEGWQRLCPWTSPALTRSDTPHPVLKRKWTAEHRQLPSVVLAAAAAAAAATTTAVAAAGP
jgi:hypothetical protein